MNLFFIFVPQCARTNVQIINYLKIQQTQPNLMVFYITIFYRFEEKKINTRNFTAIYCTQCIANDAIDNRLSLRLRVSPSIVDSWPHHCPALNNGSDWRPRPNSGHRHRPPAPTTFGPSCCSPWCVGSSRTYARIACRPADIGGTVRLIGTWCVRPGSSRM